MNRKDQIDALFRDYAEDLFRYLRSFRLPVDQTYDLVQTVFLKTLDQNLSKLDNPKAWLFRVGRNLALNELKRSKRETPVEDLPEREDEGLSSPLDTLLQAERHDRLAQAFSRLNAKEQELLRLQLEHDFNYAQLAAIVGKNETAVRVAVSPRQASPA